MRITSIAILLLALGSVSGCASLSFLWGGDGGDSTAAQNPVQRNLASIDEGPDNTLRNEREAAESLKREIESENASNLGSQEFSNLTRRNSESARRGFRRQASIWDGLEGENEGSLWNPENQNNFYFSRNLLFSVGDLVTLEFEPDLSETLNNRLTALYRPLLKKTPQQVVAREVSAEVGQQVEKAVGDAVKNEAVGAAIGNAVKEKTEDTINAPKRRYFTTQDMTLRVTEVTPRGLLKVEGSKTLFLKNASFDLKVSGLLREADVGGARKVASSQLIDQKVEIVK